MPDDASPDDLKRLGEAIDKELQALGNALLTRAKEIARLIEERVRVAIRDLQIDPPKPSDDEKDTMTDPK